MGLIAACSKEEDGMIAEYKTATIQAGKGLGSINLGMKLADFVTKFGTGNADYIAGDGEAIEINFSNDDISFLFPVTGECFKNMPRESWRTATKNLQGWIATTPSCGGITLSSISIRDGSFYDGQSDRGVKLGDAMTKTYEHGKAYDPRPQQQILAGMSPQNPEYWVDYVEGIIFYYTASNPKDIESTNIRRITIYQPDQRP